jgi:hypothetical protein
LEHPIVHSRQQRGEHKTAKPHNPKIGSASLHTIPFQKKAQMKHAKGGDKHGSMLLVALVVHPDATILIESKRNQSLAECGSHTFLASLAAFFLSLLSSLLSK